MGLIHVVVMMCIYETDTDGLVLQVQIMVSLLEYRKPKLIIMIQYCT